MNISAGRPISYTSLSEKMNSRLAIRAIASANEKNLLAVALPPVNRPQWEFGRIRRRIMAKKWLLEDEAKMTDIGQTVLST
jgi:methylated-DNA-[protein]-cysteine S-methyltransferase